jgi:hypothetical protein
MEEQQRLSHYQELICAGHVVSVLKKCGQKWQKSPTKTLIRF